MPMGVDSGLPPAGTAASVSEAWQEMQPPILLSSLPFSRVGSWAGISACVKGWGAEATQKTISPDAASNIRAEKLRLLKSLEAKVYGAGARNFSWQPPQPAPSAGNLALKPASSLVAANSVKAL